MAVVVRLLFWFAVVGFDTAGGGDEPDYHRMAADLSEGRGFITKRGDPTAERPPLYPALLAPIYSITGPDPDAARAVQTCLGALIVLLVYVLAARLFSKRTALLAAALAAVNPSMIYLSALIMTENLYVVMLLLILLLTTGRRTEAPVPIANYAVAGVIAGLSSLTRPTGFAVALAVATGALLFGGTRPKTRAARAAVFLAMTIAVIAPWTARNYVSLERVVLFTSHGGITFYESNNMLNYEVPEFRGIVVLPRSAVPRWDEIHALPEAESDRLAWRLGLEFIRDHPREFSKMAWWKFARFWRFESGLSLAGAVGVSEGGTVGSLVSGVDALALYWILVVPLFCLGLALTARSWRRLVPVYAVVAAHVLLALAFHGSLRARAPIEPVMAVMAAGAAAWLVALVRRGVSPR